MLEQVATSKPENWNPVGLKPGVAVFDQSLVAQRASLRRVKSSRVSLEFLPSDGELAQDVANATPPVGVTFARPATCIKASASGSGGTFVHIAIEFTEQVSATMVAAWLCDCWKKHAEKRARINRRLILLKKRDILWLIKREIAKQDAGEARRRQDDGKV